MIHDVLQPKGWALPRGYANGIAARGRHVYVAGQVAWDAQGQFTSDSFIEQVRQCLLNIVAVLGQAGAGPEHLVRLTWYVTSRDEYLAALPELGRVYRDVLGRNYPAMAAVQVLALMEARAKVEIEATAVIPDPVEQS